MGTESPVRSILLSFILIVLTLAIASALAAQDEPPILAGGADTVYVASPTGEKETDRASILAALDAVQPGGIVQFAPGTYLVGESLRSRPHRSRYRAIRKEPYSGAATRRHSATSRSRWLPATVSL